jgi:steroid 5-alpha reductase family enzyme
MSITLLLALVAAGLSAAMAGAWLAQQRTGNSGWVDAAWSYATGAAGVAVALMPLEGEAPGWRQWLVAAVMAAWGLRLGTHIALRAASGHDDPRYAALRREWGAAAPARMFRFLQVQALAAFLPVLSVLAAARGPEAGFRLADGLALLVVLVAVAGEAVADGQLRRFRADPANRGRVCEAGLWGWSRHPNYFFEWLFWCAWPVMAAGAGWGWMALSLVAPAWMWWLLVHVSGIPPLEAAMVASRGERYRDYQRRVSAFVPWPAR